MEGAIPKIADDWQVRQADQALRIYFVNFLTRTEWHRRPASTVVDEHGRARRFLDYAAKQQGVPQPRVAPEGVRDYLAHLAVHQQVSAEGLSPGVGAKRGERLPVVLSMPETMALLSAMSGTPRLMAALIYGGGLRATECCELRIKDLDFDQGLVGVRRGKGDKDRSTLLAEVGTWCSRRAWCARTDCRYHRPCRSTGCATATPRCRSLPE